MTTADTQDTQDTQCTIVADIRHALAGTLRQYGKDRLELEFRLGRHMRGTFVPGVSEAGWQRLRSALDRCKKMQRHYTETREFIAASDRGEKFVQPVGEAGDGDGSGACGGGGAWMFKKRLHNVDADMGALGGCRASISLEEPGNTPQDTPQAPPSDAKFVRHKRRWSYRYKCWSMDVTSVSSNLPHQLDDDGVSHEVEIELVDTAVLFSMPLETLIGWGLRLAQDMAMLAAHKDKTNDNKQAKRARDTPDTALQQQTKQPKPPKPAKSAKHTAATTTLDTKHTAATTTLDMLLAPR